MTAPNFQAQVAEIAAPLPKVTGGVLFAPLSANVVIPTDATSPLDVNFIALGRVSGEGVDKTEDRGQVDQYDWGGNLIAVLQDKFGITVKFKLLQLMNSDVQAAAHGAANVTVTTAGSTTNIASVINANLLDTGVWVIDAYYMTMSMRYVLPYARVTTVGAVTWVNKAIAAYDLTVRPFPDGNNNHAYEYWTDTSPLTGPGTRPPWSS